MKKALIAFVLALIAAAGAWAADDVVGVWKSIDDKTGKPQTITALYLHGGKLYGRILVTFEEGSVKDTIYAAHDRTKKFVGDPPYAGFDFVWALEDKGKSWNGTIFDPKEGKEYVCKVWLEGSTLIVRGQLKVLGIGRNQKWVKAAEEDLPSGFAVPDASTFTPSEPKLKK